VVVVKEGGFNEIYSGDIILDVIRGSGSGSILAIAKTFFFYSTKYYFRGMYAACCKSNVSSSAEKIEC